MNANGECLIEIDRVQKRYGERVILQDVSLSIRAGRYRPLVGPSGGGKSTLLRCINGLNTLDDGEIRVGPHRLAPAGRNGAGRRDRDVRRLVGMIFQDFQLFPHLTALENVAEAADSSPPHVTQGCTPASLAVARARGPEGSGRGLSVKLSGGQKQRVAIARALAMEPKALLCDEITSALDPELKHEVLEVLTDLKQEGMTLVMVTHEIGFAAVRPTAPSCWPAARSSKKARRPKCSKTRNPPARSSS